MPTSPTPNVIDGFDVFDEHDIVDLPDAPDAPTCSTGSTGTRRMSGTKMPPYVTGKDVAPRRALRWSACLAQRRRDETGRLDEHDAPVYTPPFGVAGPRNWKRRLVRNRWLPHDHGGGAVEEKPCSWRVYTLFKDGEVQGIGKAPCYDDAAKTERYLEGRHGGKKWDAFDADGRCYVDEEAAYSAETAAIAAYKKAHDGKLPPLNKVSGGGGRRTRRCARKR